LSNLGWILFFVVAAAGIVLYNTKYTALQNRYDQLARENEMWINQAEEMKHKQALDVTRQSLARTSACCWPTSLLTTTASISPSSAGILWRADEPVAGNSRPDPGFGLYRRQHDQSLHQSEVSRRLRISAAKGAAIMHFLMAQGISADRLTLIAHASGSQQEGGLPALQGCPVAGWRFESEPGHDISRHTHYAIRFTPGQFGEEGSERTAYGGRCLTSHSPWRS